MKTVYHFYADPGHAWLKVHVDELVELGIDKDISIFSYQRDGYAFLEEDEDAGIFLDAMAAKYPDFKAKLRFKEHHTNNSSRIRGYASYVGVRP